MLVTNIYISHYQVFKEQLLYKTIKLRNHNDLSKLSKITLTFVDRFYEKV